MNELSLCVIARNEEKNVSQFLTNIKDFVDEIIFIDTGSTDRTLEIAQTFNCKVFSFKQEDSLSKPRNFSLDKATKDWILVLDLDEKISEKDFLKIRKLIEQEEYTGYYLIQRQYTNRIGHTGWISSLNDTYEESKIANGWYENPILRLFKNDKRIRYEGIVHEIVDYSVKKISNIGLTDIPIHHFGLLNVEQTGKPDRNIKLLKKELQEGKKDKAMVYVQIATNFLTKGKKDDAISYFKKSLEVNPNFVLALTNLAGLYIQENKLEEAEKLFLKALQIEKRSLDLSSIYNNLGIIYAKKKEFNRAIKKFEKAVSLNPKSADAYYNLSLVYQEKGKNNKASLFFEKAIQLNPKYAER